MTPPSHRRWFRFSLRTFLVLLTLFCVWLGIQVQWIKDRHDVLARYPDISDSACPSAPWSIRILGERGVGVILLSGADDAERERIVGLFPESQITNWD